MSEATVNKEHLAFLDLARGIAVLGVFIFHTLDPVLHRHEVAWNSPMEKPAVIGSRVIFGVSLCSYHWIEMRSHRLGIRLAAYNQ